MASRPEVDEELWFTVGKRCPGHHYILGNPHTFPGRMMGWCPAKQRSFFFSRGEVEDLSTASRAWIAGFLAGNEPAPPVGSDADVESEAYRAWQKRVEQFRQTGWWPSGEEDAV